MVLWAISKSLLSRSRSVMSCQGASTYRTIGKGYGDRTNVLLPLPETGLLSFDLLGEALPELLLFLLEFGVIELLDLPLAELASLHLLLPVVLVVQFLRRRDEV